MKQQIKPVVNIDLNNLYFLLHTTAVKAVNDKYNNAINIVNLGVDYKNNNFVGAGDFIIIALHNEKDTTFSPKDKPVKFKAACIDAICSYMKVFAGEDIVKELRSNKNAFKSLNSSMPTAESIINYTLAELLLEDTSSTTDLDDSSTDLDDSSVDTTGKTTDSTEDNDKKLSGIGYYIEYSINIEGLKKHNWYDLRDKAEKFLTKGVFNALKTITTKAATGLFGGVFDTIKGLHMNIGGKEYRIGAKLADKFKKVATGVKNTLVIAGKKFKKVFGKTNLEELDLVFQKELRAEFPNTTANSIIYKVDTLLIKLKKQKKMTAELNSKLLKNGKIFRMEYVITLLVSGSDENYEQYTVESLRKCFIKALRETKSLKSLTNIPEITTFSTDNIIKVDDFTTKLGVKKIKKLSVSGESIKKQLITLLFNESILLNEDSEIEKKSLLIYNILKDEDNPENISEYKLTRLARIFKNMTKKEFNTKYKTTKFDTANKLSNALIDSKTKEKLYNDILKYFESEAILDDLLDIVKKTFPDSLKTKNKDINADLEINDLYIFCLPNVVRFKDNEENNKETK